MARPSTIIDSGGHICEPELVWTEYTTAKLRDDVLQVRTANGKSELFIENRRLPFAGAGIAEACIPGGMAPNQKLTWADILPGSHDPNARLSVMDEERIERALLFPSVHLLWGDIRDPAVAAETCRAYNNWMSDFCKTAPNRLCAMGIVPLQDIDLAVREARRLRELGLSGLISRPERFGDLAPFGQMAVMMDLIAGGVMDRFPDLRVGFFESGLGWMPHWIDRLDEHFEVMGHQTPWLKRRPSEIFAAQCFVSMEADEAAGLQWMAGKGLANCILWGTDYPYFDSTYPGAFGEAEKSFFAAGPDIADLVVLQNPTRFMGLGG